MKQLTQKLIAKSTVETKAPSMFKKGAWIAALLFAICLGFYLWNEHAKMRESATRTICWTIGKDLIAKTNSPMLQINPILRQPMESFLASPTKVEGVKLGDNPQNEQSGWRDAKARLYLTNERQERAEIRIGQPPGVTNFVILGWHTEKATP